MIAAIQTYLARHALYRSFYKASHFKCVDTYIRYLIWFCCFSCTLAFVWVVEKCMLKTKRKSSKRVREEWGEWMDGVQETLQLHQPNAYNGCDSHKYRLVFFSSKGENDKYKRGESIVFLLTYSLFTYVFVLLLLLLMNIFFFIFFFSFHQGDVAIISRHRFYVEWWYRHFIKWFQTYMTECI